MQLGLNSMRKMQMYRKGFSSEPLRQLLKCTISKDSEKLCCLEEGMAWRGLYLCSFLMGGCREFRLLEMQRGRVRIGGLMLQQEKYWVGILGKIAQ